MNTRTAAARAACDGLVASEFSEFSETARRSKRESLARRFGERLADIGVDLLAERRAPTWCSVALLPGSPTRERGEVSPGVSASASRILGSTFLPRGALRPG